MLTISSDAECKLREFIQQEPEAIGLRIYVRGGGCHGYQYGMAFEAKIAEDDTVIERGDLKIMLDSQSAPLLKGSEVKYLDNVQGSRFSIKNPQTKTTCGCGSSFSA
ncbi:MAG: iron-sulfur cluster insertion protein ErpA [Nitrospira sp.]|nr:iron-sulfur cluster insertion protein ErpA [Nitrospira sp.]